LNREASQAAKAVDVCCGTDVTGFSLLGHAWEMALASAVRFRFEFERIPFVQGAKRYASEYIFPGGSSDNRLYYGSHVNFNAAIDEPSQLLLFDAQTSGGLLLAVHPDRLDDLLSAGETLQQPLWVIGEVLGGNASIEVV
jgi:selenide,water dikinase